ncbi:MAG TPA: TonB-dependent receptor [Pyrinomonadaceae bacterium]|mgnify:CR=1 FL=1|nr:TonB-dependent receptor [Pyrinomonadaceae bacterium]
MNKGILKQIGQVSVGIAIALVFSLGVVAQSNTGTITGTVQDANGAAVPSASVKVTNVGTNETKTVVTDSNGVYYAPSLSNGVYRVSVTASGFQPTTVTDARLAVGDTLRVNISVKVQGVEAAVEVTADQTPTDTETATLGDTVLQARIQDNPVNGRDFTQLLATVPGSVQSTNQFQTAINGIPSTFGGSSVLVDGIDASRVDVNGTSNVLGRIESRVNRVSMDSIQEVQVLEQNYSAQYGQALGAVINPITKSGTNNLHGSVFEYFRNEGLDAGDALAGKQRFRLNQFGGNLSGPIVKDKWFFFANYEGVRQTRGQTFNQLVYTQLFRNGLAPALRPLVDTIPLPQRPYIQPLTGLVDPNLGEYQAQRIARLREDTGSVKIDYQQSDKSRFSARYNINDSNTDTPYGVGIGQVAPGKLRVQLFKFAHNYAFNASTTNEFGFGINHNFTDVGAGDEQFPRIDLSFVDFRIATPGPAQFSQRRTGVVYQFLDTMTMIRGDHTLKFGADIRLNRRAALSREQYTLTFFGLAGGPGSTSFQANEPFVISRGGNPNLNYANENFAFFINDNWRAHPRLSLNLGLRYDVSTVSREKNGLLQNFDLTTMNYTAQGQKLHNVDKNNFGPRVGFAFDVFGNTKTVIRGGYGIFYNRELPASYGSPAANSFPQTQTNLFDWLFCATPPPTFSYPVDPRVFDCGVSSAYVIERDLKTAMAQHWSLGIQQNIGFGTIQAAYVGNHVTHILTDGVVSPRNINRADPVSGVRPLTSRFGDIYAVGGYPQSNYNAMQLTFRRNLTNGLRFNANYTWSHTIDDVVGFFKDYQDENNARAERASSDQDVRHNFTLDAGYDLKFRKWFGSGPKWLIDGWQINSIVQIRSGLPVTITRTGGIFSGFSFRPNIVPGVSQYCQPYSVPNCQFNPAAFSDPGPGVFGNAGRNILRGPGFAQVDASLFKNTRLTERMTLNLRLEVFNLLNRANYADPSGGISCGGSVGACSAFGRSTSTVGNQLGGLLGFGGPRQVQLSARLNF